MSISRADKITCLLGLPGILTIAALAYWPGLSGTFLLDTIPSLKELEKIPDQPSLASSLLFVLTGQSGPTGRPLALLSFLLNDSAWPTASFAFKYTNLLLHLLNGVLVFWFAYRLLAIARYERPLLIALLACLIWLLQPLQISTVLYVIQRMTELSALFTLAALITWLYGRQPVARGDVPATWYTSLSIIFFGVLAILSKENGALIPAYILALEVLLKQRSTQSASLKRWLTYFAILPTLILMAYIIYLGLTASSWGWRPFTLTERLLSEARALVQYIAQIIAPRAAGAGIFHDDFPVSSGLLKPVETLPAVLLILTLLISAWRLRGRLPLYSFAVAWFFSGHLLESTAVPLELYFGHRNYLPMLGILLMLTVVAVTAKKRRFVSLSLLAVYTTACIGHTFLNAILWGQPLKSAIVWAAEKPKSRRAQMTAASAVRNYQPPQHREKERHYVQQTIKYHPGKVLPRVNELLLACRQGRMQNHDLKIAKVIRLLEETSELHPTDIAALHDLAKRVTEERCLIPINTSDVLALLAAAEKNPLTDTPEFLYLIHYVRAHIYAAEKDLDKTIRNLSATYQYKPDPNIRLQQAYYLYSAGLYADALDILNTMSRQYGWLKYNLYRQQIDYLRLLAKQARRSSTGDEN